MANMRPHGRIVLTFLRYGIITCLLLASVFMIMSMKSPDWMNEEVVINSDKIFEIITDSDLSKELKEKVSKDFRNVIPEIKAQFSLQKTCLSTKMYAELPDSHRIGVPVKTWCFNNDVFKHLYDYNIPLLGNNLVDFEVIPEG